MTGLRLSVSQKTRPSLSSVEHLLLAMYFPFRSPIGGGALPHTAKTYWEYGGEGVVDATALITEFSSLLFLLAILGLSFSLQRIYTF